MNVPAQTKVECGVYPDVPEEDYFRWPAVSNSRLGPLLKSPAHCRYFMDHPKQPTDAMILGSAVDCLVLTPTLFNERFMIPEQCSAITKNIGRCSKNGSERHTYGNKPGVWYCSQHGFKLRDAEFKPSSTTILTSDQASTAYAMAKAVFTHPGASVLLDACEEKQLSLVWRENINLLCKGRLDGLSSELQTIVDLKTCADASPEAFSRKITDFSYHRQAAMYMRGCSFHGIEVKNYVIIAVESEPPHAVALYSLTERPFSIAAYHPMGNRALSPVEYGNHQLLRLLDSYEKCEATGEWPGYNPSPVPISLPAWTANAIERE